MKAILVTISILIAAMLLSETPVANAGADVIEAVVGPSGKCQAQQQKKEEKRKEDKDVYLMTHPRH